MPKKITSVKWEASNIPPGLSFDTKTGTFSGTSSQVGEHVVPVTVETNYGKDTKSVIITIENTNPYPVHAVGAMSETWSENAEADANGFRKLQMPDAYKLLQHMGGFGAKTVDGKYYCCGITNIKETAKVAPISQALVTSNTPFNLTLSSLSFSKIDNDTEIDDDIDNIDEVRVVTMKAYFDRSTSTGHSTQTSEQYVMLFRYNNDEFAHKRSYRHWYFTNYSAGNTYNEYTAQGAPTPVSAVSSWKIDICGRLPEENIPEARIGISYGGLGASPLPTRADMREIMGGIHILSKDRTQVYALGSGEKVTGGNGSLCPDNWPTLSNSKLADLDFRAIKVFNHYIYDNTSGAHSGTIDYPAQPIFNYLSEDKLLDNDAEKFTYGKIRDVWVYKMKAYVVTEDNKLYEATAIRDNDAYNINIKAQ